MDCDSMQMAITEETNLTVCANSLFTNSFVLSYCAVVFPMSF